MSYGDEQAEARRLHSILEEGEPMTPPARPDPVAALETAMYPKGSRPFPKTLTEDAEGVAKRLAEQGYVLVNADVLAEALATATPLRHIGGIGEPNEWAAAILAALEKQR